MNITKTDNTIIVEMTPEEAQDMRNAYRFAQYYWQMISAGEFSAAKEVYNRIALSNKITHNAIADIVGH